MADALVARAHENVGSATHRRRSGYGAQEAVPTYGRRAVRDPHGPEPFESLKAPRGIEGENRGSRPVAGIFDLPYSLVFLDSGFRRNDEKGDFSTFYRENARVGAGFHPLPRAGVKPAPTFSFEGATLVMVMSVYRENAPVGAGFTPARLREGIRLRPFDKLRAMAGQVKPSPTEDTRSRKRLPAFTPFDK